MLVGLDLPASKIIEKSFMKKIHSKVVLLLHPDKGGDTESFQNYMNMYKRINDYLDTYTTIRLDDGDNCSSWSTLIGVLTDWNATPSIGVGIKDIFLDMDALLYHMLENVHGFTFKSTGGIKEASHFGAVCCPDTASPDWLKFTFCVNGQRMVDPGNHLYAVAMCILIFAGLLPRCADSIRDCNNEKMGDYLEAILGLSHIVSGAWNNRLQKITIAINKLVAALAQFNVSFAESCADEFMLRLPINTILKHLGPSLDDVLSFWRMCNMEKKKVANCFLSQSRTQASGSQQPHRQASGPQQPPPPPPVVWKQLWSGEHGHFYYWNTVTGVTAWEVPTVPFVKYDAP